MKNSFNKILHGYESFRKKYTLGDESIMNYLSNNGQNPQIMVVACCDSRVDPALILQCDPGDLFVVRNVANIIPPFEKDNYHHGTSAALEFGVRFLNVEHIIVLGHSQCGGIMALLKNNKKEDDFITNWVSIIRNEEDYISQNPDECAKNSLKRSYANCLSFPWIKEKVDKGQLMIHLWFFDIKTGQIFSYSENDQDYINLNFLE
jgi:carbonic anhydrase